MLKLCIIAAILAYANAYYNHGPAHQPYYGNYGQAAVAPAPIAAAPIIPVDSHHASFYNHQAYENLGGSSSHAKIIEATYPGSLHKSSSYPVTNPTGYIASDYAHGSINHHVPAAAYVHPPSAISAQPVTLPYTHVGPVAVAPSVTYNNPSVGNYAHSRYAVNEGPSYAHSRYSINGPSALSYGHARYPIGTGHGIQRIGYNPVVSHMGYQSHAAQSYAW